jgi:hypothetical protein
MDANFLQQATEAAAKNIRLECLKLAGVGREGHHPDQIIEIAETFANYVNGADQ